ncbi:hypothetical protein, partial [Bacteroides thetaiotaomicron]|uniref:hypothetical protein n=1 Tax=Bacteroides thetaiotaomicron TaxID=818 RepID=UPI001F3D807B
LEEQMLEAQKEQITSVEIQNIKQSLPKQCLKEKISIKSVPLLHFQLMYNTLNSHTPLYNDKLQQKL